jgi:hypothetical protein
LTTIDAESYSCAFLVSRPSHSAWLCQADFACLLPVCCPGSPPLRGRAAFVCGSNRSLGGADQRPPPYHGGSQGSLAYTRGHARHNSCCKSPPSGRDGCVARRRTCCF